MRLQAREMKASWSSVRRSQRTARRLNWWRRAKDCSTTYLLPALEAPSAGLSRAESQLQRQELPGDVVVEDVEDAPQAQPVRHGPRTGWTRCSGAPTGAMSRSPGGRAGTPLANRVLYRSVPVADAWGPRVRHNTGGAGRRRCRADPR